MARGDYTHCVNRYVAQGYSKEEARILCAKKMTDGNKNRNDFLLMSVDAFPADEDENSNIKRSQNLEINKTIAHSAFARIIKIIKSQKHLKIPSGAMLPFKAELPMKNLNRLQTKMKKLATEEQKYLTAEQLERRAAYAGLMKKDSEDIKEIFEEFIDSVHEEYPTLTKEEMIDGFFGELNITENGEKMSDNYLVYAPTEIGSFNDGLKNIIKFPVILAKEMINRYAEGNYFKPYPELRKSIEGVSDLPIMIEHSDSATDINTVGYVKNLKSDNEKRVIKGTGYLQVSKTPEFLLKRIKSGEVIPVSIGFFSKLGESGVFNGEQYDSTQEDIVLNHLAICVRSIPRCPTGSCGINLDSETEDTSLINNAEYEIINIKKIINICKLDKNEEKQMEDSTMKLKHGAKADTDTTTDDVKAMMERFWKFMGGDATPEEKNAAKNRILKAFKDGEQEKMDAKDNIELLKLQDSLKEKEAKILDLQKKFDDSNKIATEYLAEKRSKAIELIKAHTPEGKYTDSYLEGTKIEILDAIAEAVYLEPASDAEPDILPETTTQADAEAEEDKIKYNTDGDMFGVNVEFDCYKKEKI